MEDGVDQDMSMINKLLCMELLVPILIFLCEKAGKKMSQLGRACHPRIRSGLRYPHRWINHMASLPVVQNRTQNIRPTNDVYSTLEP